MGALRHVDHNVIYFKYLDTPFLAYLHTPSYFIYLDTLCLTNHNHLKHKVIIFIQDQLGELLHGDHHDHWDHRLFRQLLHWQDQESEDRQPGNFLRSGKILDSIQAKPHIMKSDPQWFAAHRPLLESQFSLVGDDGNKVSLFLSAGQTFNYHIFSGHERDPGASDEGI